MDSRASDERTIESANVARSYGSRSYGELVALWLSDLTPETRECVDHELAMRNRRPLPVESVQVDSGSAVTLLVSTRLIARYNYASLALFALAIMLLFLAGVAQSNSAVLTLGWMGWIAFVGATAYYAKAKGKSASWCLWSLIVSPAGATIIIALLKIPPRYTCSGCGLLQSIWASRCLGCGKVVVGRPGEPFPDKFPPGFRCPRCNAIALGFSNACAACGALVKKMASGT